MEEKIQSVQYRDSEPSEFAHKPPKQEMDLSCFPGRKWWASQWSLSGMRGGDCGWGWGAPALKKGSLSWLDVLRAGLLPAAAFPAAGSTSRR